MTDKPPRGMADFFVGFVVIWPLTLCLLALVAPHLLTNEEALGVSVLAGFLGGWVWINR